MENVSQRHLEANENQLFSKWNVLRFIIAGILFFAGGMKAWQLSTVPVLGDGLLHARWFNICVVEFELGYGIWLVTGLLPRLTRLATICLFLLFGGVSLYKAFSGESSCGCFGFVQINPWLMTLFDGVAVGFLCCCHKVHAVNQEFSTKKVVFVIIVWLLTNIPFLYAINLIENNEISVLGTEFIGADGRKTILLEPEKWPRDGFPLLQFIEPAEARELLKFGKWTIIVYRQGCPKCQQVLIDYMLKGTPCVMCVEIPPYSDVDCISSTGFVHAKLTDRFSWSGEIPIIFYFD